MSYDNTNTGMLSRNERKEKDTHPDFQGFINVEGVEYWLSGWVKDGKEGSKMAGKKFFSLALKRKEAKPETTEVEFRKAVDQNFGNSGSAARLDDEIPFAPEFR